MKYLPLFLFIGAANLMMSQPGKCGLSSGNCQSIIDACIESNCPHSSKLSSKDDDCVKQNCSKENHYEYNICINEQKQGQLF